MRKRKAPGSASRARSGSTPTSSSRSKGSDSKPPSRKRAKSVSKKKKGQNRQPSLATTRVNDSLKFKLVGTHNVYSETTPPERMCGLGYDTAWCIGIELSPQMFMISAWQRAHCHHHSVHRCPIRSIHTYTHLHMHTPGYRFTAKKIWRMNRWPLVLSTHIRSIAMKRYTVIRMSSSISTSWRAPSPVRVCMHIYMHIKRHGCTVYTYTYINIHGLMSLRRHGWMHVSIHR